MFVPIIFTLMGFISNDLLFTCFRLHTICFPLSHFVSEVQSSLLISLLFASDNQPKVTEAIKTILKDDYNYDSTVRIFLLQWPSLTDWRSLEHLQSTLSLLYAMLLYWRWRRYGVLQEQAWTGNACVGSGCFGRRNLKKRKWIGFSECKYISRYILNSQALTSWAFVTKINQSPDTSNWSRLSGVFRKNLDKFYLAFSTTSIWSHSGTCLSMYS